MATIKSEDRKGWACLATAAHAVMRRALQLAAQRDDPEDVPDQVTVLHNLGVWVYELAVVNAYYHQDVSVSINRDEAQLLLDCWAGMPDRVGPVRVAEQMVRSALSAAEAVAS
jgi:hypothetical protein